MAKVKGTILVPLVKALRTRKDEVRALLAPDLHRYMSERILVTDWYPEDDHLALLRALGKVMGITSYVFMGTALAQYELGGVYKSSLYPGDALRTMRSWAKLWPLNHDTGELEIEPRRGGVRMVVTDFENVAYEICEVVTGYAAEALRMSIGEGAQVAHVRCRSNKAPKCVWEIDLPRDDGG